MQKFTQLIDRLFHAQQEFTKRELLINYFSSTSDPDRGYALAILADLLTIPTISSTQLRQLIDQQVDPELFSLSYQYVADLAETIALLWPMQKSANAALPKLSQLVAELTQLPKQAIPEYLISLLNQSNTDERWVLLKLVTGKLTTHLTNRIIKQTLAVMGHTSVHSIEEVWHQQQPPYTELFAWLTGKTAKPRVTDIPSYLPIMLANSITTAGLAELDLANFQIGWLWDGIRIQLISKGEYKALFNQAGDDLSRQFPELMSQLNFDASLDGELLINSGNMVELQQRLKCKKPSPKIIKDYPVHLQIHDALMLAGEDLRSQSLIERRTKLEHWFNTYQPADLHLSETLSYTDLMQLTELCHSQRLNVSGLFFKSLTSEYTEGRTHSNWYQLKRDPFVVDAVLMYAQRGQGRYANFYAEYTLGLWQDQQLLPIGKPYLELSKQEVIQIDAWVKKHTLNRFGPVRAVAPNLVFELAFDAVQPSKRHVAGFTLRFPRVSRVRWDKSALEASQLSSLQYYVAN
ncbi:MAG: hypothetical protein K0S11_1583 [Gammaproteobacteria bacterium]|nr:hypothetical protein [Gammaproteobacteria bacterium]